MARKQKSNELDAEDRNAMPDSEFAFPRVRKEPLNDASHVRNAIARFDQVRDVSDAEREEAFRRIQRAARRFGVEMTESRWQELGKPRGAAKGTAGKARGKPDVGGMSKADLMALARKLDVTGRSAMSRADLEKAVRRAS